MTLVKKHINSYMGAYMESAMSTWSCLWSFSPPLKRLSPRFPPDADQCLQNLLREAKQPSKQCQKNSWKLNTRAFLSSLTPLFRIFPRMLYRIFSALLLLNFLLTFFQTSAMTPLQQERLPLMLAVIGDCRSGCLYFQAGGFDLFVIKFPPTVLKKTSVDIFWKYEQLIL